MTSHRGEPQAGASVPEIVDDIEQTRAELGETIDALASKLDVKSQVKNTASEAAGQAAQTAQQRWPEMAVVLVTAVVAMIAWRRLS